MVLHHLDKQSISKANTFFWPTFSSRLFLYIIDDDEQLLQVVQVQGQGLKPRQKRDKKMKNSESKKKKTKESKCAIFSHLSSLTSSSSWWKRGSCLLAILSFYDTDPSNDKKDAEIFCWCPHFWGSIWTEDWKFLTELKQWTNVLRRQKKADFFIPQFISPFAM